MGLEAVLFDLDGTIIDSERDNVLSVVLAVRRFGRELTADERHFIVGHSWNEIHQMITRHHGLQVAMDELIALAFAEKKGLLAAKGYTPMPGAVEAVARLGRRVPLAVVSGASQAEVEDAIDSLDLRAAFQFLMGAETYQRGKPHPEPYQLAMQRLGVRPEGCLVLEDAEPGIISGRSAGARVIAIRAGNFSAYDLGAAHLVVDTLDEVTDKVVDSLFGMMGAPSH